MRQRAALFCAQLLALGTNYAKTWTLCGVLVAPVRNWTKASRFSSRRFATWSMAASGYATYVDSHIEPLFSPYAAGAA